MMRRFDRKSVMYTGCALAGLFPLIRFFEKDTWSHMVVGRTMVLDGFPLSNTFSSIYSHFPWKNTEWLFDLFLFGFCRAGGYTGLELLQVILVDKEAHGAVAPGLLEQFLVPMRVMPGAPVPEHGAQELRRLDREVGDGRKG